MILRFFLVIFFVINPITAFAENFTWIIGGGPKKENSQIQIERNVKWASEIIKNKSENSVLKIFYSDGDDPTPDIINFIDRDRSDSDKYLLDMVFGGAGFHPSEYINHTILDHSGSTHPDNLIPALKKDFSKLKESDSALILYNGHGWGNSDDYGLGTLRLWTDVGFTAYDFEKLLSNINDKTPTRFILTQCFSGGFSRIIHPEARGDTMDLKGNRCGFMAESATREAEGCSASLKVGEYRDYTTYMFAALDGKTRLGNALVYDPDINQDKKISLREAHLYSLINAYSTDLSRSTSEYYLEKWEPWYIRWLPKNKRSEDSIFHQIMVKVLHNNQLPPEISVSPSRLRDERSKKVDRFENLKDDLELLKKKIKSAQNSIIEQLEQDYPEIKKHHKNNFEGYSDEIMSDIRSKVKRSNQLSMLNQYFEDKDKLDLVLLDAERALTQIEKIARLQKLAKIDSMFPVFANQNIRDNFDQLISCEDGFL